MTSLNNKYINWIIEEKYHGDKNAAGLATDIKQLQKGKPLDYIIGFTEFCGVKIDLSYKPLIPRPETEFWVNKTLEKQLKKPKIKKLKCLDIFAGSGCIGIAVLKHWPQSIVDFADIEVKFLKQIELNLKLNNIAPARFKIIQSDIFSQIKGKYDYIFANPPYVCTNKIKLLPKSVKNFEPHIGLNGGKNGLTLIKQFLSEARQFLKKLGILYMEFSPEQKKPIEEFLLILESKVTYEFYLDQYKKWRYLKLKMI